MQKLPSPYRPRVLAPISRVAGLDYDVLDELLGYALRRAQVGMFLAFHAATRGLDITPPRFTALVIVGANPGIGQSSLGQVLGIARSGAMMLTDWMEERGLAERKRRPNDGRSWGVHLSARGEEFLARMKRRVSAEDRKRAACLDMRERRELLRLLNKLAPWKREPAFRKVSLGPALVTVERDARGGYRLRSPRPLNPYPARLTERLLRWAKECPERTFVAKRGEDGGWRRISYGEALEAARRIGQGLLERGLSAERPLMILSENDLEHAMLALAALHVGVPFVPVSPAYSLVSQDYGKLRHAVRLMTPGLVFAAHRKYAKAIAAAVPAGTEVLYELRQLMSADTASVDAAHAAIRPDSISKFLLTSGSTGMPKAVIHTQQMLTSNLQMIVDCLPFLAEEPPVLVDWLPWNHTFGGSHNYGLTLYNGGTLYIDEGKPAPQFIGETLRNLREVAPTVYFNVPRGFEEIVRALQADPALARNFFSRVKMLFYAAASLSQPIWDALHRLAEETVGERILMITGLGMTETAPFAICANWEAGRSGGIGHPAPGTEMRLVPVGDKLEVRYQGPNVTPGYWRQPDLTRASFDDEGYFRSGDAARFIDPADPQQGLAFDGRIAEDFKLDSGTWVSVGPLRGQVIAAGDPWVQDAVIAGHDRREVCALVIPRPGTPDTPELHQSLQRLLDTLAARSTGGTTRIARALLLAGPLSIDAGEVTDKGSINQRAVLKARADLVEMLYAEPYAPQVLKAKA